MKTVSLEPANFELSELYHRNVQSLNNLAQLNFNAYAIILRKKSEIFGEILSPALEIRFHDFLQITGNKLTVLIFCIVLAAALNSTNLQNLVKCLYPCLDMRHFMMVTKKTLAFRRRN